MSLKSTSIRASHGLPNPICAGRDYLMVRKSINLVPNEAGANFKTRNVDFQRYIDTDKSAGALWDLGSLSSWEVTEKIRRAERYASGLPLAGADGSVG
jgi:hypothetical protein